MNDFLKSLEGYDDGGKVEHIADELEAQGFKADIRRRKRGKKNIFNVFYTRDDVDAVFVVIYNVNEGKFHYTVLDYAIYKKYIKDDEEVILNRVQRTMGDFKIVLSSNKYVNVALHRLVFDDLKDGEMIDHVTHSACINTRECLRRCNNMENCRNKKFYSDVVCLHFSVNKSLVDKAEKAKLIKAGFEGDGRRLYSPDYKTQNELYTALADFENKYLGKFRYNPLNDFTETWYAYLVYKMLGYITAKDLEDYNRDFMISRYPEIAQYYQL
jgi:hypothetical protein